MSYTSADARQGLLDEFAGAIEEIGRALACVGEAYDLLDEHAADRLEEEIFGPLQTAYGRAKRTHTGFAQRFGLPERAFAPSGPVGLASQGAALFLHGAIEAAEEADLLIGELQDSMAPVEVGDAELRAGLAEVRELLTPVPHRTSQLLRVLGR
ncbi:hypothetical protein [Paraconexibacter sp.]|uniref:hypothetical protein n=1 Tax=Paraconexibacter sp. TaxID=2949640 RepID=UPI00356164F2